MPFGAAGMLTADEICAIVVYVSYSNDIFGEAFVLGNENFLEVEMPNANGFMLDDRPEMENVLWRAEPRTSGCKGNVVITIHASVVDETPQKTAQKAVAAPAAQPEARPAVQEASAAAEVVVQEPAMAEVVQAAANPALIAADEGAFR